MLFSWGFLTYSTFLGYSLGLRFPPFHCFIAKPPVQVFSSASTHDVDIIVGQLYTFKSIYLQKAAITAGVRKESGQQPAQHLTCAPGFQFEIPIKWHLTVTFIFQTPSYRTVSSLNVHVNANTQQCQVCHFPTKLQPAKTGLGSHCCLKLWESDGHTVPLRLPSGCLRMPAFKSLRMSTAVVTTPHATLGSPQAL